MQRLLNVLAALSLAVGLNVLMAWAILPDHPVNVAFWAGMLAILPIWRLIAARKRHQEKRRRINYGLCRACGYDLRGSNDQCPECGRAFEAHEKMTIRAHDGKV